LCEVFLKELRVLLSMRVRGVEGLRVADASVMPQVNRGHTMAPETFIGEMTAQIIRSEKH